MRLIEADGARLTDEVYSDGTVFTREQLVILEGAYEKAAAAISVRQVLFGPSEALVRRIAVIAAVRLKLGLTVAGYADIELLAFLAKNEMART